MEFNDRRAVHPEYDQHYKRGWTAANRASNSTLDKADSRGEPNPWYDGYHDNAAGRPKWHSKPKER